MIVQGRERADATTRRGGEEENGAQVHGRERRGVQRHRRRAARARARPAGVGRSVGFLLRFQSVYSL